MDRAAGSAVDVTVGPNAHRHASRELVLRLIERFGDGKKTATRELRSREQRLGASVTSRRSVPMAPMAGAACRRRPAEGAGVASAQEEPARVRGRFPPTLSTREKTPTDPRPSHLDPAIGEGADVDIPTGLAAASPANGELRQAGRQAFRGPCRRRRPARRRHGASPRLPGSRRGQGSASRRREPPAPVGNPAGVETGGRTGRGRQRRRTGRRSECGLFRRFGARPAGRAQCLARPAAARRHRGRRARGGALAGREVVPRAVPHAAKITPTRRIGRPGRPCAPRGPSPRQSAQPAESIAQDADPGDSGMREATAKVGYTSDASASAARSAGLL